MSGKYLVVISLALIISSSCLVSLPLTWAQNSSVKTTSQQEANGTKGKKPDPAAQSQDKKTPPKGAPQKQKTGAADSDEQKDAAAAARNLEEKRKKLVLQAIQTIDDTISQAKELHPVVKIKIRSVAADALWNYREEEARRVLTEDFRSIASISIPQQDAGSPPTYKKRDLEEVKAGLKKALMVITSSHDPTLTQSLLAAEKIDKDKIDKNKYGIDADEEIVRTWEMLDLAFDVAATNPDIASRIIRDSLKTGINPRFSMALIGHRRFDPLATSAIFNEALSMVRVRGDLWEFQMLVPFVLPVDAPNYLADPLRAKDTNTFMEYAAVLLAQQLESPQVTINSPPELIMREIYLWRSMLVLFRDLMPERVWMVNTRLNQLSALQATANNKPVGENRPVPGAQANRPPTPQDMLKKFITDAESAIGFQRDFLFSSAAIVAMRMDDLSQALSLIEKIEDREVKAIAVSSVLNTASTKALDKEGPDKALSLARGIKRPITHVVMFSKIINVLRTLGKREQATELLAELSVWLENCDNNAEKARGILTYLDYFAKDDIGRAFSALNILIRTLNNADIRPPANPMPTVVYWYPEFHDFRKSLGPLARADFERAWQEVQLLKNKEALLLVQAALCNEFLKADQQKQAQATKKVSK